MIFKIFFFDKIEILNKVDKVRAFLRFYVRPEDFS